jgi:hypothetical protein
MHGGSEAEHIFMRTRTKQLVRYMAGHTLAKEEGHDPREEKEQGNLKSPLVPYSRDLCLLRS